MSAPEDGALLRAHGVHKRFGVTEALRGVPAHGFEPPGGGFFRKGSGEEEEDKDKKDKDDKGDKGKGDDKPDKPDKQDKAGRDDEPGEPPDLEWIFPN